MCLFILNPYLSGFYLNVGWIQHNLMGGRVFCLDMTFLEIAFALWSTEWHVNRKRKTMSVLCWIHHSRGINYVEIFNLVSAATAPEDDGHAGG